MSANKGKAFDKSMKLLMVGDSGVGKSCLLLRFVDDKFNPSFITTIGIDFKIKTIDQDGRKIKLQIWDTAGQERFRTITTAYYRGAMGIIIVYDVTDHNTFDRVETWYKTVQQHAKDDAQVIIVGNKCDEEDSRMVSTQEGEELANRLNVPFIEASAKNGLNVSEVFYKLSKLILEKSGDDFQSNGDNGDNVDIKNGNSKSSSGSASNCC
ncbi:Rab family GTPase [Pichia kluyveri]|uniref:Ras-related protein SEC4 n=1 Tax=Pichia kluyveri TaxID=36015 RepID=A0AAV5R7C1_PICKL|nr:Rab family GTPase [Pichia kluyveri]